jgi:hypothetical protein
MSTRCHSRALWLGAVLALCRRAAFHGNVYGPPVSAGLYNPPLPAGLYNPPVSAGLYNPPVSAGLSRGTVHQREQSEHASKSTWPSPWSRT